MKKTIIIALLLFNSILTFANDTTYVNRQLDYIQTALQASSGNKMTLQAYKGFPVDADALADLLAILPTKYDPDFQVVELIRVLFYSNGEYDNDILPVLETMPFWLNNDDTTRNYWTENHMCMWMTSNWLLHERYDWEVQPDLYPRLTHYLELKRDHGFYEFFSSVYFPYTLSGLLNLYEFAEDQALKNLAGEVAQKLLIDLLRPTTSLGVYYPAAGRNYPEKYMSAYGQNHSSLIYLLTGFGEEPTRATHAGAFLATSTLPVDDVIASWSSELNMTMQVGHDFESTADIHAELSTTDRVVFQWSFGGYAHPTLVEESFQLLADSGIWEHKDWAALQPLSFVAPENAPTLAEELNVISYSSGLTGHDVHIYKNDEIAMMSVEDLWPGKVGFQVWPIAATVGTTAVFPQAGNVLEDWSDRDRNIENTHLPHIEHQSNLALLMYRPEPIPGLLKIFAAELFEDKEVALFWEEDEFDEIIENGNWLLGRQNENYIAVRLSCTDFINTWRACPTNDGQAMVMMIGDDAIYSSFENFQAVIDGATFSEEWYFDEDFSQNVYYAQVTVDSISLDYAWGVDSLIMTSIDEYVISDEDFNIYPNPFFESISFDVSIFSGKDVNLQIINSLGQSVYMISALEGNTTDQFSINTSNWPEGMYSVIIESEGRMHYKKLLKL